MSTRTLFRTVLGLLLAWGLSVPVTALECVEPALLATLLQRLETEERPTPEIVEEVLGDGRWRASTGRCGAWDAERGAYRLAPGHYWVWRNNRADLWIPVSDPETDQRVGGQLERLGPLLREIYPDGDYRDITFYPFHAADSTFLPPGFHDGQRGLSEAEALKESLVDLQRRLAETFEPPGTLAEQLARREELKAEITRLQEQVLDGRGVDPETLEARAPRTTAGNLGPETSPSNPEETETPGGPEPESNGGNPRENAGGDPNGDDPNGDDSDGKTDRGTSPVAGSGKGILPSGAPPWLTDFFRMVLTYFGIDKAVEAAALALYLLEPELMEQLAELSGALTEGLVSESLDQVMAAARKIYGLYNSLHDLSKELKSSESFKQSIEALAGAIEELPTSMRKDLDDALGNDLAKHLGEIAKISEVVSEIDLGKIQQGEFFTEASREQIRRRVADAVEAKATEELARIFGEVGIQGLSGEAARRLLEGEEEAAAELMQDALVHTAAQRLGLPSKELEDVLSGDLEKVAEQRARQLAETLLADLGLPSAQDLETWNGVSTALEQGDWRQATRPLLERLPDEQQGAAEALLEALGNSERTRAVLEEQATVLLEDSGLKPKTIEQLVAGKPLTEIARQHLESQVDEAIDWSQTEGLRKIALDLDLGDPEGRLAALVEGEVSLEELRGEILRSAESQVLAAIEKHTEVRLQRARTRLPATLATALEAGESVETVAKSYLQQIRSKVANRHGDIHVEEHLAKALPEVLRPPMADTVDVEELERRIIELLRPKALSWPGEDARSLVEQLAARQIERSLGSVAGADGVPEEAMSAWLEGRFDEGMRYWVKDSAQRLRAETAEAAQLTRDLLDQDLTRVFAGLTASLWQQLETPWSSLGPRLLEGAGPELVQQLVDGELDRRGLATVSMQGWPAEDEACPEDPTLSVLGGDGTPWFCSWKGAEEWLADALRDQLKHHAPSHRLLGEEDLRQLLAGRGDEVAQRILTERLCPDTPRPQACSLTDQVAAQRDRLRIDFLDRVSDGSFVFSETEAGLLMTEETEGLAAQWAEQARQRLAASLALEVEGDVTPAAMVRRVLDNTRAAAENEPSGRDWAPRSSTLPALTRQRSRLLEIELGQELRNCVLRGLIPPESGRSNEPLDLCRQLLEERGGS